jgi:hypothetical protein
MQNSQRGQNMAEDMSLNRSIIYIFEKVKQKKKPLHFSYKGFTYKIVPGEKVFQRRQNEKP